MDGILTVYSFDGVIAGADVSGSHEKGSAAKMGTSAGNKKYCNIKILR